MAYRDKNGDNLGVRGTSVACLVHHVSSNPEHLVFVLLTLPTGGGRAVLTKGKEEFQKKAPATTMASRSRMIRTSQGIP